MTAKKTKTRLCSNLNPAQGGKHLQILLILTVWQSFVYLYFTIPGPIVYFKLVFPAAVLVGGFHKAYFSLRRPDQRHVSQRRPSPT